MISVERAVIEATASLGTSHGKPRASQTEGDVLIIGADGFETTDCGGSMTLEFVDPVTKEKAKFRVSISVEPVE